MARKKKKNQDDFPCKSASIVTLEDIYSVINYVQTSRMGCSFLASSTDAHIMENLFVDCEIKFQRSNCSAGIRYSLSPPPIREIPDEILVVNEEYQDEIVEDGQCF